MHKPMALNLVEDKRSRAKGVKKSVDIATHSSVGTWRSAAYEAVDQSPLLTLEESNAAVFSLWVIYAREMPGERNTLCHFQRLRGHVWPMGTRDTIASWGSGGDGKEKSATAGPPMDKPICFFSLDLQVLGFRTTLMSSLGRHGWAAEEELEAKDELTDFLLRPSLSAS
ncbi:hypothetical protein LX36DRAFT_397071 [Colletotrichum falcatum]|nr:hypothetical protein LX36DRAFT_397071 [Colletotrichum falcatum]